MENLDDKQLAIRVRDGDAECFAALVDRFGSRIFSLSLRIIGSHEDAEELTQDVFLKVYEAINSYRGESAFSTWLYRIAYNKAISHTRRRKRYIPVENDAMFHDDPQTGYDLQREEKFLRIEQSIAQLHHKDRLLVELYYYQDKSIDELSYITGLSTSNVKTRLFRIRKKIYEEIKTERHE